VSRGKKIGAEQVDNLSQRSDERAQRNFVAVCYVAHAQLHALSSYRVTQKTTPLPNDQKIVLNRVNACK